MINVGVSYRLMFFVFMVRKGGTLILWHKSQRCWISCSAQGSPLQQRPQMSIIPRLRNSFNTQNKRVEHLLLCFLTTCDAQKTRIEEQCFFFSFFSFFPVFCGSITLWSTIKISWHIKLLEKLLSSLNFSTSHEWLARSL